MPLMRFDESRLPYRVAKVASALAALMCVSGAAHADDEDTCIAASERAIAATHHDNLLEARSALVACTARVCPDIVRASCQRRLAEINQAIPAVVFEMKDAAGNDLAGVQISVDGSVLTGHLEGAPVVLDPGKHSFHFQAAGLPAVDKDFVLRHGERDRHERIVFGSAPVPAETHATPAETHATSGGWSAIQIGGIAAAAVGVGGIAIGAIFGLKASSDRSSETGACGSTCATVSDRNNAANYRSALISDSTISDVGFIAGGALVATGAVLFFTGRPRDDAAKTAGWRIAPGVGPASAGVFATGAF
jgi:hypothetical protein